MNHFKVGDRVRCVESYGEGAIPGDAGTVVGVEYGTILVRWDDYRYCRHSCGSLSDNHHGWNIPYTYLEYDVFETDFGELPVLNVSDLLF